MGLLLSYTMPVTFTIPLLQFGSTAWYQVSTPDFYLFDLTLLHEVGTSNKLPKTLTLVNRQSTCENKEVVRLAIQAIEKWMQNQIDIYEVE